MFKWTCVVALIALALTFICGYILELNHVHRLPLARLRPVQIKRKLVVAEP